MQDSRKVFVLLYLLAALSGLQAAVPTRCFENVRCESGVLLKVLSGVNQETCAEECGFTEGCDVYVLDEKTELCSLYQQCTSSNTCAECSWGFQTCSFTGCFASGIRCDANVDTIIEVIEDSDLVSCLESCNEEASNSCSYFEFEETNGTCTLLTSCESYDDHAEKEIITSRYGCDIKDDYNCFQPYRCIGEELRSMQVTNTVCFEECQTDDECQWSLYDDESDVCSLLKDCQRRIDCRRCQLASTDCEGPVPNFFIHPITRGQDPEVYLRRASLKTSEMHSKPLDQSQIPLNLGQVEVACSNEEGKAVLCEDQKCFFYDMKAEKWAPSSTKLNKMLSTAFAVCTILDNNQVVLGGVDDDVDFVYTFKLDMEQPDEVAQVNNDLLGSRRDHCVSRLGDGQYFVAGGVDKDKYYVEDTVVLTKFDGDLKPVNDLQDQVKYNQGHACGRLPNTEIEEFDRILLAGGTMLDRKGSQIISRKAKEWSVIGGPKFPFPMARLMLVTDQEQLVMAGKVHEENNILIMKFTEEDGWEILEQWVDNQQSIKGMPFALAVGLVDS